MGRAFDSFIGTYVEEKDGEVTEEEEDMIKAAAASLYSGGRLHLCSMCLLD
jgi:hypothetical protein